MAGSIPVSAAMAGVATAPVAETKSSTRQGKDSFAAVLDGVSSAEANTETQGAEKDAFAIVAEAPPSTVPSTVSATAALDYFLATASVQPDGAATGTADPAAALGSNGQPVSTSPALPDQQAPAAPVQQADPASGKASADATPATATEVAAAPAPTDPAAIKPGAVAPQQTAATSPQPPQKRTGKTAETESSTAVTGADTAMPADAAAPILLAAVAPPPPTDPVATDIVTPATDIAPLGTVTALTNVTIRSLPVANDEGDAGTDGLAAADNLSSGTVDEFFAARDAAEGKPAPTTSQAKENDKAGQTKEGQQGERQAAVQPSATDNAAASKQTNDATVAQVRGDPNAPATVQPASFHSYLSGPQAGHERMSAHDPAASVVKVAPQQPVSDAVGIAIGRHVAADNTEFTLRLDPAELGRIEVRMDIGKDGQAVVSVQADNAQTFDLLRRDSQALERALADAGLRLENGGLNFSLRQQDGQPRQQFAEQGSGNNYGSRADDGSARGSDATETLRPNRRSASALLDVSI